MQTYNCGKESDYCPELSLALDYCDRRDFVFDVPPMLFPSLKLKFQHGSHGCNEAIETEQTKPPHRLTTNCSLMLAKSTFVYTEPAPINTIAPPILPEPQKRPVGRPRLHPKKYVDPNRVKRVAKGDKPLGRPRTKHLQPPVEKRPRGRPRKDTSKELVSPREALSILSAAAGTVQKMTSE